jgi:5S rRNA maturation endonuclease (ribonuclease M5)
MKVKTKITEQDIFSKITPLEIYEFYMPHRFVLNKLCKNPFTGKDNNPSFIIGDKFGTITHIAFNSDNKGDCISFVCQLYNIDRRQALSKIANDLKYGTRNSKVVIQESFQKEHEVQYSTIQVIYKPFTQKELEYWEDYYQGLEDLKRENIYSIKKAFINRERMKIYENNMSFGYYYEEIDRWKLYCPENPKINNISFKWRNNVNFDYIENLKCIDNVENAFISKSKKDAMVLQKALNTDCIIRTQSENPSCFNQETIEYLKQNSNNQIVIFDSDAAGKKNSKILTDLYDFKHCNVPDKYLKKDINDFAELAKVYGLRRVTEHFKNKKFI